MKIFVDDARPAPAPEYQYCSVPDHDSCVSLLKSFGNDIETISLDYDLGGDKTGLDLLVYMKEHGITPGRINIHSDHETGVPEMYRYAKENFPGAEVTLRKWQN